MEFAQKMKAFRAQKGYTQEQAAEALAVSRQTVSNWETGRSLPDILSVVRMSELYGCSLYEWLKGDTALLQKMEQEARAAHATKRVLRFAWGAVAAGILFLVLGQIFAENPVLDFLNGALPWVLLGLLGLAAVLYLDKEKQG